MSAGGLRRRNVGGGDGDGASRDVSSAALDKLKRIDFYTKVQDDCVQKSQRGGVVTVLVSIIMFMLFWNALSEYFSIEVEEKITVDTRLSQKTRVQINITFPQLRCTDLSIDAMDSAGGAQLDLREGVEHVSLDALGAPLPEALSSYAGCQPCGKAVGGQLECCNTCRQLIQAHEEKGMAWDEVLKTDPRCTNAVGCQLAAGLSVTKMSGNIKVALGGYRLKRKDDNLDSTSDTKDAFNTSHVINSITFGEVVPGISGALDGTAKFVRHGVYTFNYYLQLVPTVYVDLDGNRPLTNQYSVSHKATNIMVRGGELAGLPGVFFIYDFSPFLVVKTAKAQRFTYFLTSVCAIIGGVFSIASLVEVLLSKMGHV